MKTLYESILDDEDILVSKFINRSKNPFIILKSIYDNIDFNNDKKSYEKWQNSVYKELKKINLPNWIKFGFFGKEIEFTAKINRGNVKLFSISYDAELNMDYICGIFYYYSSWNKLNHEYIKWIKNFEITYGFKPDANLNEHWKVLK